MDAFQIPLSVTTRILICLLILPLTAGLAIAQNISFGSSGLAGVSLNNPTSLQFGPDGRLYVAQQNGTIHAYVVVRNEANKYIVTSTEIITLVKNIPNHNDDGARSSTANRQVTGILLAGTIQNPVLYVSSSDPRIGAYGSGGDLGLDTNSGVVSRLTCGGLTASRETCLQWDMVHLVRGLPRSEENHSVNGLQLSADGNTLYLAVGGHTNAGAPSNNFAFATEYALSAAVLAIDLPAIEALGVKTDSEGQRFYYDLPTLDDPTRPNVNGISDPSAPGYDGVDVGDPWGGNNGLNQAKVVPGGPVRIFATGFRNLYDMVITESGRMYGVDNGANGGWGGYPQYEESYGCTNNYLSGEPGSTGPGPDPSTYPSNVRLHDGLNGTIASNGAADAQVNNKNGLHLIPEGYYAGHPTPVRGNPAGAGLYYNGTFYAPGNPNLPVDWPSVPVEEANPVECDFQNSGVDDGALANYGPSTNGIAEYTASNFGGALKGNLLMAGFSSSAPIYRAVLNVSGDVVTNCTGNQGVPNNCNETLFSGFGSLPLDVIAQGDNDPFPGTVWAATYGSNFITVFEPADYDGGNVPTCTGIYDDTIDEDSDGYTNADEIDNGTDPCSAGSRPNDNDGTLAADGFKDSDRKDLDDDDDGVLDVNDAFAIDPMNGKATKLPIVYDLFNETPGVTVSFFGLGFTGFMTNGSTDYLDQFIAPETDDPCAIVAGGTAGLLTYCATEGDAFQGYNTQANGLQFGIDVGSQTRPFTIRAQINGPFFGGANPVNYQSQGIYLGTGDQDNYLKLVLKGSSGTNGLQVLFENAGVPYQTDYVVPDILLSDGVVLIFSVDPAAGTVQPAYALDGGSDTHLGPPLTLSGKVLAALQGTYEVVPGVPSALAVGTIATSRGGTPFSATWDYFIVTYDHQAPLFRVNAGGALVAATDGGPDWAASTSASPSPYLVAGGENTASFPLAGLDPSVPPGTPPALFAAERWDPPAAPEMRWSFPTGDGDFVLRLYVMNGYEGTSKVGQRVFDVNVEGAAGVVGLDLVGRFGHRVGGVVEVPVTVTDGALDVEFRHVVENPLVNAIEVLGAPTNEPVNTPPLVSNPGSQFNVEGEAVSLAIVATDPDGPESLSYSATGLPTGLDIEPTSGHVFGSVEVGAAEGSPYAVVVRVSDGAAVSQVAFDWSVTAPGGAPPSAVLFRVNAGGALVATEDEGGDWIADEGGGSAYLVAGGEKTRGFSPLSLDPSVPAGTPAAVFSTERYDQVKAPEMRWSFPTGNGDFVLRLYVMNGHGKTSKVGQRVFDVNVEGAARVVRLDLVRRFGHRVGGVVEVPVTVTDGALDVEFRRVVEDPLVNAIEVLRAPTDGANALALANQNGLHNGSGLIEEAFPTAFALIGVYPNPTASDAIVTYDLPEQAHVKLEVYDVLGRRVYSIDEPEVGVGAGHLLRLQTTSLGSGTYFFRIIAEMPSQTAVETGRITIIK